MKTLVVSLLLLLAARQSVAQRPDSSILTSRTTLNEFMDQRFGLFIHWGPVALRGTEIGWSRGTQVPIPEYDALYKEFNPVLFDADAWAATAKKAGVNYLTITAKHHDGFCLWPTAFSEYSIKNTPFKRDVVGELAKACKKQGIKFCIYFTVADWHDPNYPIAIPGKRAPDSIGNMPAFVATMKGQLKELIQQYDPYMLWFDGNWEYPWKNEYATELYSYIKRLKPSVIINNRLGANNSHPRLGADIIGDYATPEQKIGEMNMVDPWETCMTLCTQWAWKPNDPMKSLKECLQTLAKTAGGNGNLLFNIAPMADGRIELRQQNRIAEMGSWLAKYGESIYATKGGPYKPNVLYASTRKANRIYIHLFSKEGAELNLPAPGLFTVQKVFFLQGTNLNFKQEKSGNLTIQLPDCLPDSNNTVIVLELNGNALSLPVINPL